MNMTSIGETVYKRDLDFYNYEVKTNEHFFLLH